VSEVVVNAETNVVEITSDAIEVVVVEADGPQGPRGLKGDTGSGGALGRYGSFYDSTDQAGSSTPQSIALGETAEAAGISIENGDEIVFSEAGTYSLTFSIQFANFDNAPHTAVVWVEYQGDAYPDSATRFDVPSRKSATIPGHLVGTVNYVATAAAGGRVRIMWVNGNDLIKIESYPAADGVPAVPGIILTVTQVMYTQVGPQGDPGVNATPITAIGYAIDGGGAAITAGLLGSGLRIPFDGTIESVTLLADQTGSIVVDIWKDTYANYPPTVADSICASAKPTLSSADKSEDTTLTGWTKTINEGDVLFFNVDSASTVQNVTLILKVTKT
jgi:hypothetical protein